MVNSKILKKINFFADLNPDELKSVSEIVNVKSFSPGDVVFSENVSGGELFIIQKGKVKITKMIHEMEKQTLTILKENEFFGELSLLDGRQHSATAEALTKLELLTIEKVAFDNFIKNNPVGGYKILRVMTIVIAGLLRQMDSKFIDMIKYVWGGGLV
ncbi:cyclic nucleotide-binding domain-containing protein [Candidatus Desantisbacteria bacterium]|nr:cyclic nucleotide-binding domain-containing protein [Candidatus Desantisbacteria bacterium]